MGLVAVAMVALTCATGSYFMMKLNVRGTFRSYQRSKAMFAILVGAKAYTLTVSRVPMRSSSSSSWSRASLTSQSFSCSHAPVARRQRA